MRSIIFFLIIAIITIAVPGLIMGLASVFKASDMGIIISQVFVILFFVLIFNYLFKFLRKYERETLEMIARENDPDKLKDLRQKRRTYKSKAAITNKILSLDYSQEELDLLKKYATSPEDMEHYYSLAIGNASKEKREDYKIRRENFQKRFGNKAKIYPDFKENMKTSLKWMAFFFLTAITYNLIPPRIMENDFILVSVLILGMFFLAVVMINTILWIVRTLKAYWNKDII